MIEDIIHWFVQKVGRIVYVVIVRRQGVMGEWQSVGHAFTAIEE